MALGKFWKAGIALALSIGWLAPASAAVYECGSLATDLAATEGGRIYYRADDGTWLPLTPVSNFDTNRVVHLLYVTRETMEPVRFGVVVIKTGRDLTAETAPSRGSLGVSLRRPRNDLPDDPCSATMATASFEGSVSSPSYDTYHDTNVLLADDGERTKLDNFHIRYTDRRTVCKDTNGTFPDSPFAFDFRTNRTQFSFNTDVVDHGVPSALAGFFPRAVASRTMLADQTVTIRRYKATNGQASCVPFDARVTGRGYFIRINDLDARTKGDFRLSRTGELRFTLQY